MQWVKQRLLLIVSAIVLVAVVGTSINLVSSDSVYAETADDQGNSTCAVEKIGWLVCPILEKTAQISDAMFDRLANNFLRVDPQLVSNNAQSGTRQAWEIARNLANIMFIIAFIVIVLSQVTGQGISNYGIKRMLPRLVVAAIAVNVSYFICQLAVDTSNIFGYEIKNALVQISDNIGPSVFGQVSQYSSFSTGADRSLTEAAAQTGILTVIAVGVIASAVVWVMIGPLIAVVFTVFVATLGIIVILMLRKALIVLLIVVSPIAFVMYLLPNTEKLFNRWAKMFVQLLLVFPIVSLLLGAGQLASTIILVSSPTVSQNQNCDPDKNQASKAISAEKAKEDGYTTFCEGGLIIQSNGRSLTGASWTTGLIATGVAVAPLFAVWSVLKGALSATGSIGGKISSVASRASAGAGRLGGRLDKRKNDYVRQEGRGRWQNYVAQSLEEVGKESSDASWLQRRVAGGAKRRQERTNWIANSQADLESQARKAARPGDEITGRNRGLSQASQDILQARAQAESEEAEKKDREAQLLSVSTMDPGTTGDVSGGAAGQDARTLIANGQFDSPRLAALLEHLAKTNMAAFADIAKRVGRSNPDGTAHPSVASRAAASAMESSGMFGANDINKMRGGEIQTADSLSAMALDRARSGKISAGKLLGLSTDAAVFLDTATTGDTLARTNINTEYASLLSNPQAASMTPETRTALGRIR